MPPIGKRSLAQPISDKGVYTNTVTLEEHEGDGAGSSRVESDGAEEEVEQGEARQ